MGLSLTEKLFRKFSKHQPHRNSTPDSSRVLHLECVRQNPDGTGAGAPPSAI
jgi:hypothetical protein